MTTNEDSGAAAHPGAARKVVRIGGASGFWVEGGQIAYPVEEITIAGNLRQMFQDIVAVGTDEITRGTKRTGSVLIGEMAIAGS